MSKPDSTEDTVLPQEHLISKLRSHRGESNFDLTNFNHTAYYQSGHAYYYSINVATNTSYRLSRQLTVINISQGFGIRNMDKG